MRGLNANLKQNWLFSILTSSHSRLVVFFVFLAFLVTVFFCLTLSLFCSLSLYFLSLIVFLYPISVSVFLSSFSFSRPVLLLSISQSLSLSPSSSVFFPMPLYSSFSQLSNLSLIPLFLFVCLFFLPFYLFQSLSLRI